MDQSSYTFQALCSKYEDFRSPAFTIKVEGKEIKSSEIPLTVEVDLCADGSAGGCSFQIESMYDYEHAKWLNDLTKTQLHNVKVHSVLQEVTSEALGRPISVAFTVGELPAPAAAAKQEDKLDDLIQFGSQFDNFTIK